MSQVTIRELYKSGTNIVWQHYFLVQPIWTVRMTQRGDKTAITIDPDPFQFGG